jgi:nucleoid-associated protein YgaU
MSVNMGKLAAQLSPFGTASGELKKLTIHYERPSGQRPGKIETLFNPGEISRSRHATWEAEPLAGHGGPGGASPEMEFYSVEPETLSVALFFDTYETRSDAAGWAVGALPPVPGGLVSTSTATDVRKHTEKIARLARIDQELHRPPVCRLWWGKFDVFQGVLTDLDQNYTMFLEDGTPVRATLSCTFLEVIPQARVRVNELHSADVPRTRRVTRTDTLASIAAQEYGDPSLWREIARANRVVNPRRLRPGDVLVIPRLRDR